MRLARLIMASVIAGAAFTASAFAQDPQDIQAVQDRPHLSAITWLPHDSKLAARLTTPVAPDLERSASTVTEVGRMAFRYPGLLGGWAARQGMSCESCHQGAKAAPVYIPNLSGASGTVDLTHALFSPTAEDGTHNPARIKAIRAANPAGGWQAYTKTKLANFDAPPTDPRIIAALVRYMTSVKSSPPPKAKTYRRYISSTQKQVRAAFDDILRAAAVIEKAARAQDDLILDFAVAATRAEMERVYERLDPADFSRPRLQEWSVRLAQKAQAPLDKNQKAQWLVTMTSFRAAMTAARDSIITRADLTFYNQAWLEKALNPPLPEQQSQPLPEQQSLHTP